jgi:hypothetical protein
MHLSNMANIEQELFEDNLKDTRWLGKVVDIADPNKEGRVRVKVFGKFDNLENDVIPWARPANRMTAGSASGSGFHSVPKLDSVVGVYFDNGNIHEPEYFMFQHLSDDLKSEIEGSYDNAHSLIYDTVTEGGLKVFFTEEKGLMFDYQEVQINIKNDKSVFITNPNGDTVELTNKGVLTIKVKKDVLVECENAKIKASKSIHMDCSKNASIKLGTSVTDQIILGNKFQTYFNTHQHLGNLGAPTGPPINPSTPAHLSKVVKTQ